jgi:hypothetical protein
MELLHDDDVWARATTVSAALHEIRVHLHAAGELSPELGE